MAWSQPFRPPRMAPVVAMYSSCRPGRTETPAIQAAQIVTQVQAASATSAPEA